MAHSQTSTPDSSNASFQLHEINRMKTAYDDEQQQPHHHTSHHTPLPSSSVHDGVAKRLPPSPTVEGSNYPSADTFHLEEKSMLALKIHSIIAFTLITIASLIWYFVPVWSLKDGVPWFIFVGYFFCFSLALHFFLFFEKRQYFNFHLSIYITFGIMITSIWLTTGAHNSCWFMYPVISCSAPLIIHYWLIKKSSHRFFYLNLSLWLWLQTLLCLIYFVNARTGKAWFFWPMFATFFPIAIHGSLHFFPRNWLALQGFLTLNLNCLLYFGWLESGHSHVPWFMFVFVLTVGAWLVHFWFYTPSTHRYNENKLSLDDDDNDNKRESVLDSPDNVNKQSSYGTNYDV